MELVSYHENIQPRESYGGYFTHILSTEFDHFTFVTRLFLLEQIPGNSIHKGITLTKTINKRGTLLFATLFFLLDYTLDSFHL
jgi:hypothetical protein